MNTTKEKTRSKGKKALLVGGILLTAALLLTLLGLTLGNRVAQTVAYMNYPLEYTEEVERWAAEYGVDPMLVYAVIQTESGFRPEAESNVGARGLMQMTADTFDWVKGKIAPEEALTFDDLFTPGVSVRFGTYYLSRCLERYGGDVSTAAAAYHSGWGTVDELLEDRANTENGEQLSRFPYNQMNHYVNKINKNYQKYTELYGG